MLKVEVDKLKIINDSKLNLVDLFKLALASKKIIIIFVLLGGTIGFLGSNFVNKKTYIMDADISINTDMISKLKFTIDKINFLVEEINEQLNKEENLNTKGLYDYFTNNNRFGYFIVSQIDNKNNINEYNNGSKIKVDSSLSAFFNEDKNSIRYYLNDNHSDYIKGVDFYTKFIEKKDYLEQIDKLDKSFNVLSNKIDIYTQLNIDKEKRSNEILVSNLSYALEIAKSSDIENPLVNFNYNGNFPFQLGTKVLTKELEILKSKEYKNKIDIKITSVKNKLNKLRNIINNEMPKIIPFSINNQHKYIKLGSTNKNSIIFIGCIFGFILGLIFILLRRSRLL
ncbi:hypothetical protein [Photobacterium phosphoreum]|uniref:hypothetical protein n=1 Tax=Photobacterium phosphoreum TaxID=659 RepID=UPI0039AEC2F8